MELWNEYEGRIIAGSYTLQKLLRPEGRSAFFSTTTPTGTPTVIRLIESHYDDDEILARWTAVSALKHPNLLALSHFGSITFEDTALVYAVMEPSEADLGQILRERPLTPTETHQLATSLVSAVQALHALGFVHEHIQPLHVLAVGETVKLRSDCIREAPEGREASEGMDADRARARDVHDLTVLILQALTLQRTPANIAPPPPPFRDIIANGINAKWGLAEIAQALASTAPPSARQPLSQQQPPPVRPAPATPAPRPTPASTVPTATPAPRPIPTTATPEPDLTRPAPNLRNRLRVPQSTGSLGNPSPSPTVIFGALGAVVLLLLLVLWHFTHRHPAAQAGAPAPTATPHALSTPVAPGSPLPSQAATRQPVPPASADRQHRWRVVAFTYNHEDQARAKAQSLQGEHGDLPIQVFSPNGRAPYLVTVGGPMTREDAFALKTRLRGKGFPRDLYAQNFVH
jgi:eukaryotic-like serine/threonine-protein kinase